MGFTMPRLPAGAVSLFAFLKETKYRKRLTIDGKARLAARLADCLAKLHKAGIMFCDMNPKNIYVTDNYTQIRFIDADGFQASLKGQPIPSRGVTLGYGSPDAIAKHQTDPSALRTTADDDFVLAILIFQLLIDRAHPFATGPQYVEHPHATLNDNIVARRYAFSDIGRFHPEGDSPDLYHRLERPLKTAFHRSFLTPYTVSAEDWVKLLLDHAAAPLADTATPEPDAAVWQAPPVVQPAQTAVRAARSRRAPSHPLKPVIAIAIAALVISMVAAFVLPIPSETTAAVTVAVAETEVATEFMSLAEFNHNMSTLADHAFEELARQYPSEFRPISDGELEPSRAPNLQ